MGVSQMLSLLQLEHYGYSLEQTFRREDANLGNLQILSILVQTISNSETAIPTKLKPQRGERYPLYHF